VSMLIPKSQIRQKQPLFLSSLSSCLATLLFFVSALTMQLAAQPLLLSRGLNLLSGLLTCFSAFLLILGQNHNGISAIIQIIEESSCRQTGEHCPVDVPFGPMISLSIH
jgi:hypothetical protein